MQAKASAAEADAAELRVKLSMAEEANLRLRESFTTFERTINAVLDKLKPKDREAATEAVDRAAKARSDQPRRTPRQLPGVEQIPDQVFVLMPFRAELDPIYQIIREVSQQVGLRTMRADEMVNPGRITDQISDAIARSALIVADITGHNANVLFEIGMATSLGKEVLLISQEDGYIPFDIASLRVIFYENSIIGAARLRDQLTISMKHFVEKVS